MANDIVKIKCPRCGSVLSVKNMPGLETKNVTCPVCKFKAPFTSFRNYTPPQQTEDTDYGEGLHNSHAGGSTEHTSYDGDLNILPGQLRVLPSGPVIKLHTGRNIVGRKASRSDADIQLPTGDSKRMSREHLIIDVKKVPGKGMTAYVSLYKEQVNKTYVNKNELLYGDTLVLNDGDILSLPDMKVVYEVPDEEKTDI